LFSFYGLSAIKYKEYCNIVAEQFLLASCRASNSAQQPREFIEIDWFTEVMIKAGRR
jgi:hypothetical protein